MKTVTLKFPLGGERDFQVVDASDGYHTFDELYRHRIALWLALCRMLSAHSDIGNVWRSRLHADGSSFEGWFILGYREVSGMQISYHLPESEWANSEFAHTYDKAPQWDGHTSDDVVRRLNELELVTA